MAKQKKTIKRYNDTEKRQILGELVPGVTRESVAARYGIHVTTLAGWKQAYPEWVGRAIIEQKAAPSPPADNPAPPANGVNGHPKSEPPPSTARLEITGLRGFVRESVRTELREIVREEIATMLGRMATP